MSFLRGTKEFMRWECFLFTSPSNIAFRRLLHPDRFLHSELYLDPCFSFLLLHLAHGPSFPCAAPLSNAILWDCNNSSNVAPLLCLFCLCHIELIFSSDCRALCTSCITLITFCIPSRPLISYVRIGIVSYSLQTALEKKMVFPTNICHCKRCINVSKLLLPL